MFKSLFFTGKKEIRRAALSAEKKVMMSAALSASAVFLFGTGACAAGDAPGKAQGGIGSFAVAPYSEAAEDPDLVYWWYDDLDADATAETSDDAVNNDPDDDKESRGWFLFLPSDTDPDSAKLYFTADGTVEVDGREVFSGQNASVLTAGEHTVTCGEKTYALSVVMSANDPAVFIDTASGSTEYLHQMFPEDPERENREAAVIRIYENGQLSVDKNLEYIKLRGNVSKYSTKRPYIIKFAKKTDVLGMGEAKKWVLLSNASDSVPLHNDFGWEYADAFGLKYNSDRRHADLYLNGQYRGNYEICDKVEVGPERIDIRDLEKENERVNPGINLDKLPAAGTGENGSIPSGRDTDSAKWVELPEEPEDVSGGYLLEIQLRTRFVKERTGFVTSTRVPVLIREPQNAGKREVEYARTFVNDAFEALFSADGYGEKGKHYTDYIDMDSFVNMYILQELSMNLDAGLTSFYMVLDNGKLLFSPVWDMDKAFVCPTIRFKTSLEDPNVWWANSMSFPQPSVFTAAYIQEDFREAVRLRWQQLLEENVFENTAGKLQQIFDEQDASMQMNLIRFEKKDPSEAHRCLVEQYDRMQQFVQDRVEVLTKGFSEQSAMLYYDANGGTGYVYNRQIADIGEPVVLVSNDMGMNKIEPPDETLSFAGWNTRPDGSGESYLEGDEMMLEKERSVLYAVWE